MSAEFIATAVLRASLLLMLGLAALRWLPVEKPQLRRLVALACLGASLVLPFLHALPSASFALGSLGALSNTVPSKFDLSTLTESFAVVWMVGGMLVVLQLLFRGLALRRWLAACEEMNPPASFSPSLPVRSCRRATAPCVAGFLRPVLIVPEKARAWDESTWRCVLAHELQHVRQGDLWLGWITHAVHALHWWNPLAWKLSRSAGLESEACCDDAVLRDGVKAADYARVLLRFTSVEASGTAAGFFIHGKAPSSLRLRMERLLSATTPRASTWRVVAVTCLLLTGMAGCLWIAFEEPSAKDKALSEDATQRWQANPFPADSP